MKTREKKLSLCRILSRLGLVTSLCIGASFGQTVTTVAGGFVGDGRAATQASFQEPIIVIADTSGNGYVSDATAHRIRKIGSTGTISTFAGTGICGYSGDGGPAASAMICAPSGLANAPQNAIVLADSANSRVRSISSAGIISTVAGDGTYGYSGDGGPATQAELEFPRGVVYNSAGDLFISDRSACVVRKVNTKGIISTFAGNGTCGFSGDGGQATLAELNGPRDITVDPSGNLYISDSNNVRVREVSSAGIITTVVGNGQVGFSGDGGSATDAEINTPRGLAFRSGTLYLMDTGNDRARQITNGIINTFAGSTYGYDGDHHAPLSTQFAQPIGVLPLSASTFVFTDDLNARVRELAGGLVKTVAGGYIGDGNVATSAALVLPENLSFDSAGNAYIADAGGNRIRKVDGAGTISTVAGNGISGYSGDGGPATSAELYLPYGVTVDSNGNIFISDTLNGLIREVDSAGTIHTYASNPGFLGLQTLALDKSGNLYAVDSVSCVVWKIASGGTTVTTVAGEEFTCGYNGDNIQATSAQLNGPYGIGFDSAGNLYIADSYNNRVRQVNSAGVITTVAGNGTCGYSGDNGPPSSAEVCFPEGVVVTGSTMYIADTANMVIRKVAENIITTYAGSGLPYYNGNNLPALNTNFDDPVAVAVDPKSILYILDDNQTRMREVH